MASFTTPVAAVSGSSQEPASLKQDDGAAPVEDGAVAGFRLLTEPASLKHDR